ncbi:MAG: DNA polymerase III subunit beta [Pseudomonadales bacterium]|nr:DNA polymerase III subunit beta [Ardenticatenaceae bacterium]MCP5190537.1 DNA polymerase III subunit beta [Pseudomonadales bacterium]
MKVTCSQENLAKGLGIVGRAVSVRSTLPVLGNVLLSSDNGRLKLAATNLEIVIICWIEARILEEGSITVPARIFNDLVNALPQEQIDLQLNQETQTLHIACARTEANVKGIPAEEFPAVPENQTDQRVRIDAAEFKEMINQVVFAAAVDDARPTLTGINTHFQSSTIKMAATDGFRLSVREAKCENSMNAPQSVILPARALTELARIMGDGSEYVEITLTGSRGQVMFELDTVRMISQTIDGNFPDFTSVMPVSHKTRTVLNTASFLKACKTANIFAREASHTARVRIEPDNELMPGYATISATSAETGNNIAQIDAIVEGRGIELNFNVKYITDVLSVISTPQVALETNSTTEPGVIKPVGKDDFVHIIMPMQFGR